MGYICLTTWRDLTDGHLYREGEPFPFDGREISAERLDALENGRNRAGLQLIRADGKKDERAVGRKEDAPEGAVKAQETQEQPVKPKRSRTKK